MFYARIFGPLSNMPDVVAALRKHDFHFIIVDGLPFDAPEPAAFLSQLNEYLSGDRQEILRLAFPQSTQRELVVAANGQAVWIGIRFLPDQELVLAKGGEYAAFALPIEEASHWFDRNRGNFVQCALEYYFTYADQLPGRVCVEYEEAMRRMGWDWHKEWWYEVYPENLDGEEVILPAPSKFPRLDELWELMQLQVDEVSRSIHIKHSKKAAEVAIVAGANVIRCVIRDYRKPRNYYYLKLPRWYVAHALLRDRRANVARAFRHLVIDPESSLRGYISPKLSRKKAYEMLDWQPVF